MYLRKLRQVESQQREFVLSSTRFAPHHPIFWGLSPHPWRTPSPLCGSPRQSRRSSARMRETRVFGRLIAALTATPFGAGWTRGGAVKWGAERDSAKMYALGYCTPRCDGWSDSTHCDADRVACPMTGTFYSSSVAPCRDACRMLVVANAAYYGCAGNHESSLTSSFYISALVIFSSPKRTLRVILTM